MQRLRQIRSFSADSNQTDCNRGRIPGKQHLSGLLLDRRYGDSVGGVGGGNGQAARTSIRRFLFFIFGCNTQQQRRDVDEQICYDSKTFQFLTLNDHGHSGMLSWQRLLRVDFAFPSLSADSPFTRYFPTSLVSLISPPFIVVVSTEIIIKHNILSHFCFSLPNTPPACPLWRILYVSYILLYNSRCNSKMCTLNTVNSQDN